METLPWPAITAASGGWLLAFAYTYAVLRGRLMPRSALDDTRADRDQWRDIALRSLSVTERTTVGAEVAAQALQAIPVNPEPTQGS